MWFLITQQLLIAWKILPLILWWINCVLLPILYYYIFAVSLLVCNITISNCSQIWRSSYLVLNVSMNKKVINSGLRMNILSNSLLLGCTTNGGRCTYVHRRTLFWKHFMLTVQNLKLEWCRIEFTSIYIFLTMKRYFFEVHKIIHKLNVNCVQANLACLEISEKVITCELLWKREIVNCHYDLDVTNC